MMEWVADNKMLTGLATLFGIMGLNIIGVVKWLIIKTKEKIDAATAETTEQAEDANLIINAPEYRRMGSKFRNGYGYTILEGKEHLAEENMLANIASFEAVIVLFFVIPLVIAIYATHEKSYLAFLLAIPPALIALPLAIWVHQKQLFIISNKTGEVFYFNRGVVVRVKKLMIDMDAEQAGMAAWIPRLLLNRQIVAEGDMVETKEQALSVFQRDAKDLKEITNGDLRQTWWEWNERRVKLDKLEKRIKSFFEIFKRKS